MQKLSSKMIALFVLAMVSASPAYAIKKCKDANGKWHYGDVAESACTATKITTLSDRGFVRSEQLPPKSEEELKAEEEALAKRNADEATKRAEQNERNRILSVYETEADIDRQRDNQLNSVDSNIAVHKSYLKAMDSKIVRLEEEAGTATPTRKEKLLAQVETSKKRIEEYSIELQKLIDQKKEINQKFAEEKEVYRELKAKNS